MRWHPYNPLQCICMSKSLRQAKYTHCTNFNKQFYGSKDAQTDMETTLSPAIFGWDNLIASERVSNEVIW